MSAEPVTFDTDTPHPLKRFWEAGPAGWNQTLTRWFVLVPFFIVAALIPFALQYVEDNSSWTGTQFWTFLLANCAMYACLAVALNLVVGYAGLLNLGFIAFFGIGSYAYALVASNQIHQHFPFWAALLVVILVTLAFALLVGIPALRLRGDYLAIVTLGFGLIMNDLILNLDRPPVLAGHQFGPSGLNLTGGTNGLITWRHSRFQPACRFWERYPIRACTTGSFSAPWRSPFTAFCAGVTRGQAGHGWRSATTSSPRGRWA